MKLAYLNDQEVDSINGHFLSRVEGSGIIIRSDEMERNQTNIIAGKESKHLNFLENYSQNYP